MSSHYEFQVVVMAAGRGHRMVQLTSAVPKPMLPICNKPMIWHCVKMLENSGLKEVIIVVSSDVENDIKNLFTNSTDTTITIEYFKLPESSDSKEIGTADTLRYLHSKINSDVLVISCDVITNIPLHRIADLHRSIDSDVTMLISSYPNIANISVPCPKVNKYIEKDYIGFSSKTNEVVFLASEYNLEGTLTVKLPLLLRSPCINLHTNLIDCHLYLIKRDILDIIVNDKSLSTLKGDLLSYIIKKNARTLCSKTKPINNIDNMIKILSVNSDISDKCLTTCYAYIADDCYALRANTLATYCYANRLLSLDYATESSRIKDVQISADSVIGNDVQMEAKCVVKSTNIGNHCKIATGCKMTNCIIMDYVIIESGCTLNGCIVGCFASIAANSELKDSLVGNKQSLETGKYTNEEIVDEELMMQF